MTDHRIIHRFIPATFKHGNKTACGIPLSEAPTTGEAEISDAQAVGGGVLAVSMKGKPFDCSRCRAVLELRHTKVNV